MATAGDVFHNPITGERLTVLLGADDTDGRYLAASLELPAGGGAVAEHAHPKLVEAFQVRRGEVAYRLGRHEELAPPGRRIVVPRGIRHALCNAGEQDAEVLLEVWPARRFEQLVATLTGLSREGHTDASGSPDPLQRAVIAREFADEIEFSSTPAVVREAAYRALAPVGRLLGKRPVYGRHEPSDHVAVAPWRERPAPVV